MIYIAEIWQKVKIKANSKFMHLSIIDEQILRIEWITLIIHLDFLSSAFY